MEATTLNILVDYTGCESEKDRAQVRVDARHTARLQMATHPEMLKALEAYLNVLVLPDPGHEQELIDSINTAQAAITEAKPITS